MEKLKEKVDNIAELAEENNEELKQMKDEIGEIVKEQKKVKEDNKTLHVYKSVIKSSEKVNLFLKVTNLILSILVIILIVVIANMHAKFTHYRENSISKTEILEILNSKE